MPHFWIWYHKEARIRLPLFISIFPATWLYWPRTVLSLSHSGRFWWVWAHFPHWVPWKWLHPHPYPLGSGPLCVHTVPCWSFGGSISNTVPSDPRVLSSFSRSRIPSSTTAPGSIFSLTTLPILFRAFIRSVVCHRLHYPLYCLMIKTGRARCRPFLLLPLPHQPIYTPLIRFRRQMGSLWWVITLIHSKVQSWANFRAFLIM